MTTLQYNVAVFTVQHYSNCYCHWCRWHSICRLRNHHYCSSSCQPTVGWYWSYHGCWLVPVSSIPLKIVVSTHKYRKKQNKTTTTTTTTNYILEGRTPITRTLITRTPRLLDVRPICFPWISTNFSAFLTSFTWTFLSRDQNFTEIHSDTWLGFWFL